MAYYDPESPATFSRFTVYLPLGCLYTDNISARRGRLSALQ